MTAPNPAVHPFAPGFPLPERFEQGEVALVVVTDPSGANRVYDAGTVRFVAYDGDRGLRDEAGGLLDSVAEQLALAHHEFGVNFFAPLYCCVNNLDVAGFT